MGDVETKWLTPDRAIEPNDLLSIVTLRDGAGNIFATGRVISHSLVPTICVETLDGERIHWRHDMARHATPSEFVALVDRAFDIAAQPAPSGAAEGGTR